MGLGYEGRLWALLISAAVGAAVAVTIQVIRNPKSPATVGVIAGAAVYALEWYTEKRDTPG